MNIPLMRELIDVPVVQTVVRLDDVKNLSQRTSMVHDFVLTRQVLRNLRAIAQSIKEKQGCGYFLTGSYGSGKSHFLSYISLILSGEAHPKDASCPLTNVSTCLRLFPIRLSLIRVRGDTRLEDAILSEAEYQFDAAGLPTSLSRRSKFLNHVEKAIRPINANQMDAYLAGNNLPVWDSLRKEPDRAAVAAWGYAKTLENCPVMPSMPPEELIKDTIKAAKHLNFDGVVIVIDELSEFLRSKQSRNALSEDVRYLQLLGEMAHSEPLWIIASLQEAIEQTGDISRDIIAKIKDRYPIQLTLDENHIRDLIDSRLIQKHDGAREKIRNIWRMFTESLPSFDIDFENFFRIYPVHPATITYLEDLAHLFSAHRGIVDFIVTQIRGNSKLQNQGLLDFPGDRLLTADMIYEHFRERIKTDNRYTDFDLIVRKDIWRAIDKIFTDEADKLLAKRAIDVLILNELTQLKKPKTVSMLTNILLASVTDLSLQANEQYLSDVILTPLLKESLFLRLTDAKNHGDRIFTVALERDKRGLFQKELDRILSNISPDDSKIEYTILKNVPSALPFSEMQKNIIPETVISWRGTQRRGAVFWSEVHSSDELAQKLELGDYYFAIIFANENYLPANTEDFTSGIFSERALVWTPSWSNEERETMRRYYATMLLFGSNAAANIEQFVKDEAAKILKNEESHITRIIEAGFRNGKLLRNTKESYETDKQSHAPNFIERFATKPVTEMLKSLHPKFMEVAPTVEFISRRALAPLIDALFVPGRITMAAAKNNNTRIMIEGVLIQMGLACTHGPHFVMQLDPAKSQLVKEILDSTGENIKIQELERRFKYGEWGLSNEMFVLLLTALVRSGLIEIKKDGRKIPSSIVNFSHIDEADEIQSGELLEPKLREKLFSDAFLSHGLDKNSFSLASQREAWKRLLTARDKIRTDAAKILPKLAKISEYPVFDKFDFEHARSIIDSALESVNDVADSQGASKGLMRYFSEDRPQLELLIRGITELGNFVDSDAEKIIRIADYLRDLPSENVIPTEAVLILSELKDSFERLEEVVLAGQTENIFSAFGRFSEIYSAWYIEEHKKAFARDKFESIENLKKEPSYLALKNVDAISWVHLVENAQTVQTQIANALAARCTRLPSAEIRIRALCGCEFIPGKHIQIKNIKEILENIHMGLSEAITFLSDPVIHEKLISRISALKDIEPDKSRMLEEFIHQMRGGINVGSFIALMTPQLAAVLDEALRRKITIVSRDANSLFAKISGRRLPPSRLRKIFEDWLGDTAENDTIIDIKNSNEQKTTLEEMLAAWILEHGLDETSARIALMIPPSTVAAPNLEIFSQLDAEKIARMAELTCLASASSDECLKILSREKRFPQFAWEVTRRLVNHLSQDSPLLKNSKINCSFPEITAWLTSASVATKTFTGDNINNVIFSESDRDKAFSFIEEHHHVTGFPLLQIVENFKKVYLSEIVKRNEIFTSLKPWNIDFKTALSRWPNSLFMFIDAARWNVVPDIDSRIRKIMKLEISEEHWFTTPSASTAKWQEMFFGTDDLDTIRSIMQTSNIRYYADAERADVRSKIMEDNFSGSIWLHIGLIDRLLHKTTLPLYRFLEEITHDLEETIYGVTKILKNRQLILLTDHGFSEAPRQITNGARYIHDPQNPSDTVSTMIVYNGS